MDVESFNKLCKSFDATIRNNPLLTIDEETFIFSKILQYRNKIFRLICKNEEVLGIVLGEARIAMEKDKPYKFFMIPSTNDRPSLEEMGADLAILLEDSSIEMAMKKYHIDFNVYEKAFIYWRENNKKTDADLYVDTFHNLQNFYIQKICNCNTKLLIKIATSFTNIKDSVLNHDDLLNEAFFGLHRAVNLFDVSRGHKFSTYASTWIFSTIRRFIDNHGTPVHIPVNLTEQKRAVEKIKNKFINEHERNPTLLEIYELLKKKPENIYSIDHEYCFYDIGYFGNSDEHDGNESDLQNILKDEKSLASDDFATIKEVKDILNGMLSKIDEVNERYIISNIFGFNKEETVLSKEEILENLKISPKEFDSIKNKTLGRMQRAIMKHEHLRESLDIPSGWSSFTDSEDSWS